MKLKSVTKTIHKKHKLKLSSYLKKWGESVWWLSASVNTDAFIGFFALREMVELRHSDFVIWSDLSVPDPYFIFPITFAVLMTLTQRLNPQPAGMDPTQAQVMKYMPVVFSVFFVVMPAALGLYMVVNTGIQLIQQAYMYKKSGALAD